MQAGTTEASGRLSGCRRDDGQRWFLRRPATTLRLALLFWLMLVVGGCAPQPDVMATDDDNGGQVRVVSGQLFDIVLADDYDETFCQWREERNDDPHVLEMLGSRYEPGRKPPVGVGNGSHTERYRARKEGTTVVGLVESTNGGRVCRRYSLTVTVSSPSALDRLMLGFGQVLPWVLVVAVPVGIALAARLVCRLIRRRRG